MSADQPDTQAIARKMNKIDGQYLVLRGLLILSVLLALISLLVGIQFPGARENTAVDSRNPGTDSGTSGASASASKEVQSLKQTVAELTTKLEEAEGKIAALALSLGDAGQTPDHIKCAALTTRSLIIEDSNGILRGSIACKDDGTQFFIKHPTSDGRIEMSVVGATGRPTAASVIVRSRGGQETVGFAGYGEEGWFIPREQ